MRDLSLLGSLIRYVADAVFEADAVVPSSLPLCSVAGGFDDDDSRVVCFARISV